MRFITTKYHSVIDYFLGLYLICVPFTCRFAFLSAEGLPLTTTGFVLILNGLFSTFVLGYFRIVPASIHLIIDSLTGLLLAASPWLLGFSQFVYLPHMVLGLAVFLLGICTKKK